MSQPPPLPDAPRPPRARWAGLFRRMNLIHVGWGWPAVVAATLLTMLNYYLLNTWLSARVQSAYDTLVLPELTNASTAAEAADRALEFAQIDDPKQRQELHPWLSAQLLPARPASQQLEDLFASVSTDADPTAAERRRLLRRMITGERRGVRVFWLSSPTTMTGQDVLRAVQALDGGSAGKTIRLRDNCGLKRIVLARYTDQLIATLGDRNRALNRITGWVQWVIFFVFWLIIVVVVRRRWVLRRLGRAAVLDRTSAEWIELLTDDRFLDTPWPADPHWLLGAARK